MMPLTKNRLKGDRGDSNLISLIILLPLVLVIFISIIDTSIYQMNRSVLTNIARDAARTVAIYGGAGDVSSATPLEKAYGVTRGQACTTDLSSKPVVAAAYDAVKSTPIECQLLTTIGNTPGLTAVTVASVKCSPTFAPSIGTEVRCDIEWRYGGVPGSAMTIMREAGDADADPALRGIQRVRGTAASEVAYETNPLIGRG